MRKAAYEDAAKQFEITPDEHDPAFRPFIQDPGLWKAAVADSNVAAQQDGIAALCAFLKFGGRDGCTRYFLHCSWDKKQETEIIVLELGVKPLLL